MSGILPLPCGGHVGVLTCGNVSGCIFITCALFVDRKQSKHFKNPFFTWASIVSNIRSENEQILREALCSPAGCSETPVPPRMQVARPGVSFPFLLML